MAALEELVQQLPNDQDVKVRLEEARKADKLAALYVQAKELSKAKQWQAVVNVFSQIHEIQPNYADPDDLLANAQNEIAGSDYKEKLKSVYNQALQAMESNRLQDAAGLFARVQDMDANYRDTARYIESIRVKLETENNASQKQDQDDETRRKQSLDALYAQAVGYLQSGDNAQAIETLDQLHAQDAAYPDVQKIRLTAQSRLKAASQIVERIDEPAKPLPVEQPAIKPVSVNAKPARPRWLPFAIGGAVLIVVILVAIIASGGRGGGTTPEPPQAVAVISDITQTAAVAVVSDLTLTPTEISVVIETTTNTPTPTETAIPVPDANGVPTNLTGNQSADAGTFFDDFSSNAVGWYEEQSADYSVSVQDDGYAFLFKAANYYIPVDVPVSWFAPTYIEFDVISPTPDGSYGVICNYQNEQNFYLIRLETTEPIYSLGLYKDGNYNALLSDQYVQSQSLNIGPGAANHIAIQCKSGFISLTINEDQVQSLEFDDPSQEQGYMRLFVNTLDQIGSDGHEVIFDNLYVSK